MSFDHQQDPSSTPEASPNANQGSSDSQQLSSSPENSKQPAALPDKKSDLPRRNLLKGAAIVGGALAALGGGSAIAVHAIKPEISQVKQPYVGRVREYWVQANAFFHNLVPTGKDGFMGMSFKASDSSYWAVGYVAYTPNWGKPLAGNSDIGTNTGIPGPVFRGAVGDTIRVHFRNNDTHYHNPHSMHPHGVIYTPANDGTYITSDIQPGAAVAFGQSYTYEWRVRPNSVGTWVYHDHSASGMGASGMLMEFGAELGMFGFLVLTDEDTKPATHEFFSFIHDIYQADVASLSQDYDGFNGNCYLGNTPTFTAKVGDTIRWHVGSLGKEFHAFHLHGHRWSSNGQFVDVVLVGPSIAFALDFVADNPGKWLYHCHVTDHMMGGMVGMYIVNP